MTGPNSQKSLPLKGNKIDFSEDDKSGKGVNTELQSNQL